MRKFYFAYNAKTRNGAEVIGSVTMVTSEKLTIEVFDAVRTRVKADTPAIETVVILNVIELEG